MLTIAIALTIATIVPLAALFAIRKLDLYGTGNFQNVLLCFANGLVAFGVAYYFNTALLNIGVSRSIMAQFVAPTIEEILKSLIFLYLIRKASFTYFVDGAIYGFAAGIGFAIVENYTYVLGGATGYALDIAVARVISTNLMHASASALIGIALGRARFLFLRPAIMTTLAGYLVAMVLHIGFNTLVTRVNSVFLVVYAATVGILASSWIAYQIHQGLQDDKKLFDEEFKEELDQKEDRVTSNEARVVGQVERMKKLLQPIAARFGKEKADQCERFLMLQGQLVIKKNALENYKDENLRREAREEIAKLRAEMSAVRQQVGLYAMTYIRTIFPEESNTFNALQARLEAQQAAPGGTSTFAILGSRMSKPQQSNDNLPPST